MTTEFEVYGKVADDLWAHPVAIGIGNGVKDNIARAANGNVAMLRPMLKYRFGEKDGKYITQATFLDDKRSKKLAQRCSIMMFDLDAGQPLDEILDATEKVNLFSFVWATYSHRKTVTAIGVDKLAAWIRKDRPELEDAPLPEKCRAYLLGAKTRYVEDILPGDPGNVDGAHDGKWYVDPTTQLHAEEGEAYFVSHQPVAKYRVMFVLDKPFEFMGVPGKSHTDRERDWATAYKKVGDDLGFNYDAACSDPSRLMYLPAAPNGTVLEEGGHEVFAAGGGLLSLDGVVETADAEEAEVDSVMGAFTGYAEESGVAETGARFEPKTPGLFQFLKEVGHEFDIIGWLIDVMPEDEIRNGGMEDDLIEVTCPNELHHTGGRRDDDSPMFARFSDEHGWWLGCRTDGCTHEFDGDKARALDCFIQGWKNAPPTGEALDLVPTDCMVDLIKKEWCPEAWARRNPEEVKEAAETDVPKLKVPLTSAELQVKALAMVEEMPEEADIGKQSDILVWPAKTDDEVVHAMVIDAILEKTGKRNKTALVGILKGYRKHEVKAEKRRAIDEKAAKRAATGDVKVDKIVYNDMPWREQLAVSRKRLIYFNQADPRLFQWIGAAELYRLRLPNETNDVEERKSHHMDRIEVPQMSNLLTDAGLDYVRISEKTEQHVSPFNDVTRSLAADTTFTQQFPVLDNIVHVPVFGKDGVLITEKGYSEGSRTYLVPDLDFIPLDVDAVDQAKADEALAFLFENALRDFPFSDSFSGDDGVPIYLKEMEEYVDVDGVDCSLPKPNLERGASSRTHAVAMLLQAFVRPIIGANATPLFHIDKPGPASGAGFLANVLGYILTGRPAPAGTLPGNEDEVNKTLMTYLMHGRPIVFFDNIATTMKVDSASLASALTDSSYNGRALGGNQMVDADVRNIWLSAGNNTQFSGEMVRRIVPIKLDSREENPEQRSGTFKHNDLPAHMVAERDRYVFACHVLIAWWVKCGMKDWKHTKKKKLTSFDRFSAVIGGILDCCGLGEHFLANIAGFVEDKSTDRDDELGLLDALADTYVLGEGWTNDNVFQNAIWVKQDPYDTETMGMAPQMRVSLRGMTDDSKKRDLKKQILALKGQTRTVTLMDGRETQVQIVQTHEGKKGRGNMAQFCLREVVK